MICINSGVGGDGRQLTSSRPVKESIFFCVYSFFWCYVVYVFNQYKHRLCDLWPKKQYSMHFTYYFASIIHILCTKYLWFYDTVRVHYRGLNFTFFFICYSFLFNEKHIYTFVNINKFYFTKNVLEM